MKFYTQFFHFVLLAVLIIFCYSNSLDNSWHFDDEPNIIKNENIRIKNFAWEDIQKTFRSPNTGNFKRPVALFSFALNYMFSGHDTTGYHVANICIHITSALFVYLVFLNTLYLYRKKEDLRDNVVSVQDIALLGTALWAIHPIQTQAVTYVVQREASMAAMFCMIAMYCYIRFRQNHGALRQWLLLFLAILFWILGVGTKENVAMLPLVLLGYEVAFFRTSLLAKKKYVILLLVVFLAVSIGAFLIMRGEIFTYLEALYSARPYTMWQRLITQPIILSKYLFLVLCPLADFLSLETDIFASTSLISPPQTIFANVFIFSLTLFGILSLKKFPVIGFALYFYFINQIIESSFIGLELYFEHRNYLPSMFIYFGLSWYFVKLLLFYRKLQKPFMQGVFVLAMVCVLISEGHATYLRNDVWKTEIDLLADSIEKAPNNIRPYISLGVKYMEINQVEKAKDLYKQAEKIYKKNPEIHQKDWVALLYSNAGSVAMREKKYRKAIQLLLKSSEIDPLGWEKYVNLGYLFFITGDVKNAQRALNNAVEINPQKADIYNMLGRTLYADNKYDLSIAALKRGVELEKLRELQLNLVAAYLATKNQQVARSVFLRIVSSPDDLIYQLYRAVFSSGQERGRALEKVAEQIAAKRIDYCSWIKEVDENNSPGLIYPEEFKQIEPELRQMYLEKISQLADLYVNMQNEASNCEIGAARDNSVAE